MRKNLRNIAFPLALALLLSGCGRNGPASSSGGESTSEESQASGESSSSMSSAAQSDVEKALGVFKSYSVESTNGFDYSLSQYLGKTVTNSDAVSLRADFSGDARAKRDETTKKLNAYGTGEQFTTTESTSYFLKNARADLKDGKWTWTNCKASDYFSNTISNISIDETMLKNPKSAVGETFVLTADVPDDQVAALFKVSKTTIKDLSLVLKVSSNFSTLSSLELSYFQATTYTELKFSNYFGHVDIALPE
jgi:hypothetical protein